MNNKRNSSVDILKAVATVGVIATHVLSKNLGPQIINTVWNYMHFVVPLFVFCSGYLMYMKYHTVHWSAGSLPVWWKKRAVRLVVPYYLFLTAHYLVWLLFPAVISGMGLSRSPGFILKSLLLVGVDYGWLPVLFLELMVITPLYLTLYRNRTYRAILLTVCTVSAIFFYFIHLPVDFRFTMWIPWSIMYLLSFSCADRKILERTRALLPYIVLVAVSSLTLFMALGGITMALGYPLILTHHKYPPDLFYLSYGSFIGSLLILATILQIFSVPRLDAGIRWLSTRSYALFFVHYLAIDASETLKRSGTVLPFWTELTIVIAGSVIVMNIADRISGFVSRGRNVMREA